MTPHQISLVQDTFEQVEPIAETAAMLFYTQLFALDPSLKPLFKGDIKQQGKLLMTMIGAAVRGLTNLGTLTPAVRQLGARHSGYGVRTEHYATVGSALLWTLEQGLGDAFTPEVREAWTAAYTLLSQVMQQGAESAATQSA